MRIAFLSHTGMTGTGPGEVLLHLLLRIHAQRDLSLLVLLPSDGTLNETLREERILTRVLSLPPPWYMNVECCSESISTYISMARAVGQEIAGHVKEWGAEALVINTHTSLSGLMGAAQLNLPYLLWLHGVTDSLHLMFAARHFKWVCDEMMIRCAAIRACPSRWVASVIRGQNNSDVSVVPNFTHVPGKVSSCEEPITTFCCLNSWEPHKGVDTIIEAAGFVRKRKRKFRVVLHGSGPEPYVIGLRERIQALGLGETVHLMDRTANPRLVFQNSHALISSSRIEPFGMTLIEAMSEGRPVIASETTGHLEIVREGQNGFLCPVGDSEAFAERMDWVIRHPRETAEMGQKAWKIACEEYSGEKSARLFVDLLQDMVGRERAGNSEMPRDRYWPCRVLLSFPPAEALSTQQPDCRTRTSTASQSVIGPDLGRRPTRYSIPATKDSLSGFRFMIGTHHTLASGSIQLHLYDRATSCLLRTLQLGPTEFSDNAWVTIEFEPVLNSANRVFQLDVVAALTQGRVAIYEVGPPNHPNLLRKFWGKLLAERKRKNRAFFPAYR